jgi:hypothetical protein
VVLTRGVSKEFVGHGKSTVGTGASCGARDELPCVDQSRSILVTSDEGVDLELSQARR